MAGGPPGLGAFSDPAGSSSGYTLLWGGVGGRLSMTHELRVYPVMRET